MKKNILLFLFMALAVQLFISCSDEPTTNNNDDWTGNKVNFTVVWDQNAILFRDGDQNDVLKIDSADFAFHFKSSSVKAAKLKAGNIIVVGDFAIRKVKAVTKSADEIYVETDFAAMTEAMKDATITWDYGVEFTPELFKMAAKKKGYEIQTVTSDSIGYSIKLGSIEYTLWTKMLKDRAILTLTAEKEVAGNKVAKFTAQGELKRFRTNGKIEIANHILEDYDNNSLFKETDITLTLTAAGSGQDIGIEVPLPLLPPFPIAGIPFLTFEIKALVVMNASVPPDGSSLISAKFRYTAEQGLQYIKETKKCNPVANLTNYEFDKTGQQPHTGASGPVAMSWGLAAPRFEISFGGTTIGWVQAAYLLGGDYVMLPKPCQQAKIGFYGAYGWALGGFGLTLASGSGNLWTKEKVILKAGDCP